MNREISETMLLVVGAVVVGLVVLGLSVEEFASGNAGFAFLLLGVSFLVGVLFVRWLREGL